ncbi:hypothetical protein [Trichothermofontia sp.]
MGKNFMNWVFASRSKLATTGKLSRSIGFLSLPSAIIANLNLPGSGSDFVTWGDGSETCFDLYTATVIGDGQYRAIDIADSETEPLLGMALLYGYRLQIGNVEGGIVKLEVL